jgi:hypothetical protein
MQREAERSREKQREAERSREKQREAESSNITPRPMHRADKRNTYTDKALNPVPYATLLFRAVAACGLGYGIHYKVPLCSLLSALCSLLSALSSLLPAACFHDGRHGM